MLFHMHGFVSKDSICLLHACLIFLVYVYTLENVFILPALSEVDERSVEKQMQAPSEPGPRSAKICTKKGSKLGQPSDKCYILRELFLLTDVYKPHYGDYFVTPLPSRVKRKEAINKIPCSNQN